MAVGDGVCNVVVAEAEGVGDGGKIVLVQVGALRERLSGWGLVSLLKLWLRGAGVDEMASDDVFGDTALGDGISNLVSAGSEEAGVGGKRTDEGAKVDEIRRPVGRERCTK